MLINQEMFRLLQNFIFEEKNKKDEIISEISQLVSQFMDFTIQYLQETKPMSLIYQPREVNIDDSPELASDIFYSLETHKIGLITASNLFGRITANKNYKALTQPEKEKFLIERKNGDFIFPSLTISKAEDTGLSYNISLTVYKLNDFSSYSRFTIDSRNQYFINLTNQNQQINLSETFRSIWNDIIG
jgi:hypothetical protein